MAARRRRVRRTTNRKSADDQLAAIPACHADLVYAAARLGEPFDASSVAAAMASSDPARRVDVGALERQTEKLINHLTEAGERLLAEARRLGHPAAGAGKSMDRFAEAGIISGGQRDRLVQVIDVRNLLQHDYLRLSPDRLVAAVEILRAETHAIVRVLADLAIELDCIQSRPSRRGAAGLSPER